MDSHHQIAVSRLADQLERSFRGGAWHGPALAEALAGIDAETANQPFDGAHSIVEIANHAGYWIDGARRRLAGERVDGDDWPAGGAESPAAWEATKARLDAGHRALHDALLALDDTALDAAVGGSDPTVRGMLLGLLQHNAYHAGQIVLLAKLAAAGRAAR